MIAIFDEDGGGDVDFQEFVSGLSAFSSKGNKEEKLRFAFKVYDIDRDGYISNGELFIVLKMMVGSNLKDQQLQQVYTPKEEKIAPAYFPSGFQTPHLIHPHTPRCSNIKMLMSRHLFSDCGQNNDGGRRGPGREDQFRRVLQDGGKYRRIHEHDDLGFILGEC